MEADLLRYYRVDLRDFYRPRGGSSGLTFRRLWALVQWLPAESALRVAVQQAQEAEEAKKPDAKVLTLKQRTEHWRKVGQQQAASSTAS